MQVRTMPYLALALALGASNVFAQAGGLAAEIAARQAADAELAAQINAEAVARMHADQDIRDSLTGENGLSGRYAVVGSASCLRSSAGFSPNAEFLPLINIFPPGNNPPGSNVQPQTFTFTGVRTITPGGMHGQSTVYSLAYPGAVASGFMPGTQPLVFTGGFLTGQGNVVEIEQDFTYEISADRTLTITPLGAHGTIVRGAGAGNATETSGAPPLSGRISRDWKIIVLTNADMAVEQTRTGSAQPVDRVCTRVETMYKLAD